MKLSIRRQTFFILALAISLSVSLIIIALDERLRERLGDAYWIIGLALTGGILLVLTGYVFDRSLLQKIKEISHQTNASRSQALDSGDPLESDRDPNDIMGLAREIEQMARRYQQTEASYRAIVEEQTDLICRYKTDGRLTFVNGAYARFLGKKRQELTGHPWILLATKRAPWGIFEEWPKAASFEDSSHDADGRPCVHLWAHRAIKDGEGTVTEYQAVGHDITLRKQSELALHDAKNAAESADRAKSEFLAIVSHEIRTPINGVVGFARLLRETPLTPEQANYIETIHRCGLGLETLVSDILDLSKIEAGRLEIAENPFSPRDCIEEVVCLFAEQARTAGLSLTTDISASIPPILRGDQHRLRQILTNLVGNALKFTEKGGVSLSLTSEFLPSDPGSERRPLILHGKINDTGVGIRPEEMPRLFRAFHQADTSTTRRHGGTGLGLVISKRLCELMHGNITAHSTLGAGSTFSFTVRMACLRGDTLSPFPEAPRPAATPPA
jgi:PAS domain S-box-containing protein